MHKITSIAHHSFSPLIPLKISPLIPQKRATLYLSLASRPALFYGSNNGEAREDTRSPSSELYYIVAEEMNMKTTVTLRANRVEAWIDAVKKNFLDAAPMKIVGLDCEFTDPREPNQRAAILQLSVAYETLVFHICHADEVPQVLKDFLADENVKLNGKHQMKQNST